MRKHAVWVMISGLIIIAMSSFRPATARRVIFFGDSITQYGATDSNGYIRVMRQLLDSGGRAYQYDLIGAGIGGNKIYDLLFRVDDDVIAQKPDVVYIFIGVNDVWAKTTKRTGTDADRFDRFYDALVKKIKKAGAQVIICTPLCIGEKKGHQNPDDAELDAYSQLAREVAYRNDCAVCDLRLMWITYNEGHNPSDKRQGLITRDGIHPTTAGHLFIAEAMVKALPK